ncbi:MarR family transcriptional regulator [Diaminobutyricibacter sp. McL0608]|uniref:MarR family transcriptional regulator n=1 Tax=Leifsonia sp. McL0608 TaxID=3143537 RepID=UPI0031F30D5C
MKDAVGAALAAANVMMRVAARSVVEVEDVVTTPQLRILMLISASGPQSISSVATELNVHPSNATRPCEKLVQSGLIMRSPDPTDRRFVQLELTERGTALVDHVLSERRAAMADVFARMSADEQADVAAAFESFAVAARSEPTHDGRFTFALQP